MGFDLVGEMKGYPSKSYHDPNDEEVIIKKGLLRRVSINLILVLLPVSLFFVSFLLGRYPISPPEVIVVLASKFLPIEHTWPAVLDTVVFRIRLPRIVAAMLIGSGLSVSGASFQGLFRNPLVSPQILGVASGAGFGAAMAILFSGNPFMIQISALLFGLIAVGMTYGISKMVRGTSTLVLVLAGIAVGALFSALISLTKYVADPYEKLPAIVFWLMGSLSSVSNRDILMVSAPILIGMAILLLIRWRINVLSMGDEEASALGVNTRKLRIIIIICCTIITASSVCISGIIGWVGLIIPHVGRMLVGPDHKALLPACVSIGAFYLLLVDNCARTLTTAEIPLGILTAIVGAPFFVYLLRKSEMGWS
ncbi:MAG: Cobalamin import system permease protein BtuC [Candidatus Methanolliviera sp. GoM_oil]|nr:MAG: Cobalamin import system permease protein BtuC [Candidatus Methanolliviera sp. GoM_oil]